MNRNICTRENPYNQNNPEHSGRWEHPDAVEIEEDYGKSGGVANGDYMKYECPHCKKTFKCEIPN